MTGLLLQALTIETGILAILPVIGILVFILMLYKALYKKEEAYKKMMTGIPMAVTALILLALAMIPGETLSLFGSLLPVITILIQIFSVGLIGILLASLTYMFVSVFVPKLVA